MVVITYDAIVIGSGITGGWAAKELTEKGLRTLVIERGRNVVHRKDYITEHKPTWQLPLHNARLSVGTKGAEDYPVQARTNQFRESNKHFFVNDRKHPYVEAKPFTWIQGDQVGGKSLIWAARSIAGVIWTSRRICATARSRLADPLCRHRAWYSYVERFIGVSGEKLGLPHLPTASSSPLWR